MSTKSILVIGILAFAAAVVVYGFILPQNVLPPAQDSIDVQYSVFEQGEGKVIELTDVSEADYIEIVVTREEGSRPSIKAYLNESGSELLLSQDEVSLTGGGYLKRKGSLQPNATYVVTITSISGSKSEVELQTDITIE